VQEGWARRAERLSLADLAPARLVICPFDDDQLVPRLTGGDERAQFGLAKFDCARGLASRPHHPYLTVHLVADLFECHASGSISTSGSTPSASASFRIVRPCAISPDSMR